ncbi:MULTISPECIES: acyl carrier protein [unclassified Niallia]|uniref:acyl carrier protein n=1 Tax=unclassified Niallia TaxID=2837522 RepID=UPI0030FBC3CD
MEDIETRIKEVIIEYIDEINDISEISNEADLFTLGINSVTGLRIFVAIENEFGFEFDDNSLNPETFSNVNQLSTYVKQKVIAMN